MRSNIQGAVNRTLATTAAAAAVAEKQASKRYENITGTEYTGGGGLLGIGKATHLAKADIRARQEQLAQQNAAWKQFKAIDDPKGKTEAAIKAAQGGK